MAELKENQELVSQIEAIKQYLMEGMRTRKHLIISTDILTSKGVLYLVDEVARKFNRNAVYIDDISVTNISKVTTKDTLIVLPPEMITQYDGHNPTIKVLESLGYQLVITSNISDYYVNNALISV